MAYSAEVNGCDISLILIDHHTYVRPLFKHRSGLSIVVQLLNAKCCHVLHYTLAACPLNSSKIKALDYVLFSSFSKIFRTKSKDVVDECMLLFGCSSVLTVVSKRKAKFLDDYLQSYNILCRLFAHVADTEMKNCNAALELRVVTVDFFLIFS